MNIVYNSAVKADDCMLSKQITLTTYGYELEEMFVHSKYQLAFR